MDDKFKMYWVLLKLEGFTPDIAARKVLDVDTNQPSLKQLTQIAKFIKEANEHSSLELAEETQNIVKDNDPINHPSHYTQYKGLEIIDLTEQMNFNLGNAVKYIARAGFKDAAKTTEDLGKAAWYLAREINRLKELSND